MLLLAIGTFSFLFLPLTTNAVVFSEGVVGWWKLDEVPTGSSNDIIDYSGNDNHGTSGGGMNNNNLVDGMVGDALEFDNSDDQIVVSSDSSLQLMDGVSVSFWVNPNSLSNYDMFIGKIGSSSWDDGWGFYSYEGRGGSNEMYFFVNGYDEYYATAPLNTNEWQHFVGVYNKSNVTLYRNGVYVDSDSLTDDIDDSGFDLLIGNDGYDDYYANGIIDNVRVFNRALSSSEVEDEFLGLYDDVQEGDEEEVEEKRESDEEEMEEKKESAQYKHYKKEYKNHAVKRMYEKIKHLKKGDEGEFAYYQRLKMNYNNYKHLSKRERKQILTEYEFMDFEKYKDYRGYKKYKELKKK